MNDNTIILAKSPSQTRFSASSLASSLYAIPVTVSLTGELGAGKTTFLQGFADALGVQDSLVSPTYALEQRTQSPRGEFLHLDLYRLTSQQARELLRGSEHVSGIRCIEWFDRAHQNWFDRLDELGAGRAHQGWSNRIDLQQLVHEGPMIHVHLEEPPDRLARIIRCAFHDATLLTDEQIDGWRHDVLLPAHIGDHCDAVAAFADRLAELLIAQGRIVRRCLLHGAARVHDLLRFLDFRPGGHPEGEHSPERRARWSVFRTRFSGLHHEDACAEFLRAEGFAAVATIVEPHGLALSTSAEDPRLRSGRCSLEYETIEQKLLFYADKRVMLDRVVSLEERFTDFANRYGGGIASEQQKRWYEHVKRTEKELFPEGVPI